MARDTPTPKEPPMADEIIVPAAIEQIIQRYEAATAPFNELEVQQEIGKARQELGQRKGAENLGAWAEVLAFALVGARTHESPWNTFFAPIGTRMGKDGSIQYSPDIAGTPPTVLGHWAERARCLKHPVLKARYADLVWDMAAVIGGVRRDPEMARLAIDSYLDSLSTDRREELHDRLEAALRAFDLARQINDGERATRARDALMARHREAMSANVGNIWMAFDRLIEDRRSGLTDEQRDELVADLEKHVARCADMSAQTIDPHACRDSASRLIKHYTRLYRSEDVKRLHAVTAKAFEHFAGMSSPMLAAAVLQTAVDEYRDAGLPEDSRRMRILMQQKIGESRAEMAPISHEVKIKKDDIERFLESVVLDDLGQTFVRLAVEFLLKRKELEDQVQKTLEEAPLMAHITQTIMADDHVAGIIGSVQDDPFGRLFQQAKFSFSFSGLWLHHAIERLFEKHDVQPEHFAGWANRNGLYEDMGLLLDGVRAYFTGDYVKAVHLLVPQVEHGLRSIAGQLRKPVTKAHPTVQGASVSINMGDILYSKEIAEALGPDLTLHFLALYADPRGLNLRNELAHGLMERGAIHGHVARLVLHTLLVLGLWKELAEKRR
jgi:lysyl-tRNA synthetase class 1